MSKVCGDLLVAFEDICSERLVLQHLLSTVCDDLLVVFEDGSSNGFIGTHKTDRSSNGFTAKLFLTFIGIHKTDRSSNGLQRRDS